MTIATILIGGGCLIAGVISGYLLGYAEAQEDAAEAFFEHKVD